MPDVGATKREPKGLQAHGFVGDIARENHQVSPTELVAVLLLDRPQQAAGLIEVGVVRPGVQRGKALGSHAAAAATIGGAVGTSRVPRHANHQAAVVAPVRRPPVLAGGHELVEVFLQRCNVKFLDFFPVVEVGAQWVRLGVKLVQDVQIEGVGPPFHV